MIKSKTEKKEYLETYGSINGKLNILKEQLDEIKDKRALLVDSDYEWMQAAGNKILSDSAARIQTLEQTIIRQSNDLVCNFEKVKACIDTVGDETEQAVLTYRYLRGMRWEDICDKMYYSWKQIHRIHTRAIDRLEIWEDIE